MTDAAIMLELRLVRDTVAALPGLIRQAVRDELAAQRAQHPHERVLEALGAVYRAGAPFTSSDITDALALPVSTRVTLRQALHVALAGKAPTPECVGLLMRRIVKAGPAAGWMLCTPGTDCGIRVWMLERIME